MIKEKKQHNRGIYFSLQLNEIVLHTLIVIITLHWTTILSQSEALLRCSFDPL